VKTIIYAVFSVLFFSNVAYCASALVDRGEYLKIFYGTTSCSDEDAADDNCSYTDEVTVAAGASSKTITDTFSIGTTYYFRSKAYTGKAYGCKSTPCSSEYSNETSWVADNETTVEFEWDIYGYNSYVLGADGTFTIKFDEAVYTSSADDSEFDFSENCDDCTISYQGGSGTDTLTYLITGTIDRTTEDTPYLIYVPIASIEDGGGEPVGTFDGYILLEYAPSQVKRLTISGGNLLPGGE